MSFKETVYKEYKHVITKSYEIYDDKPAKRLYYVKKNVPTDIYNMFLLETLQWELCVLTSKRPDFDGDNLELICIVLAETIGKVENELK
ncbi:hypothetical protein [Clostridium sp.]|uniref:hypothetical protein n=1 Tax=Clostridium sp. TaxID=1506 RepID=UPI003D6CFC11